MAAEVRWRVAPGTWEDAEALVGKEITRSEGVDPVNLPDIRRRLEVLAWDSPIHYDAEAARAVGHDGIVSPATMVVSWCLPAYWTPGDRRPEPGDPVLMPNYPFPNIPAPGTALFAAGCKTRYFADAHPGDRISSRSTLLSVTRKRLRIGDGAFMVVRTDYFKQPDTLVATEDMTVFRYTPEQEAA
ncbi:MAG: MaoC family dehydratase N-terminal domain-containing protein [Rhizobiaceae bacterium]